MLSEAQWSPSISMDALRLSALSVQINLAAEHIRPIGESDCRKPCLHIVILLS